MLKKTQLRTVFSLTVLVAVLLALPDVSQAQFNYSTNNGTVTITAYTGSGGAVIIPGRINFLPVTSIGDRAFFFCSSLTSVTIPKSVTSVGHEAFYACSSITTA